MTTRTDVRPQGCLGDALAAVGAGGAAVAAASLAALYAGTHSPLFAVGTFIIYAPAVLTVVRSCTARSMDAFGWPNRVTLARLALASLFGGLALDLDGTGLAEAEAWAFMAIAGVAIALDGLDGFLARTLKNASAFGARFDMEVDALLILLLSMLAWMLGKAGPWVLLIGTMRYAFVATGWLWPLLTRPVPPSMRRKAICVVQGATLTALLAPVVTPPFSTVLAAAALVLIVYSFAVDVMWLIRRGAA